LRTRFVNSSTQFDNEKSETDMKKPRMATPAITTIVDSRNSAKEGQLAFESSASVSL